MLTFGLTNYLSTMLAIFISVCILLSSKFFLQKGWLSFSTRDTKFYGQQWNCTKEICGRRWPRKPCTNSGNHCWHFKWCQYNKRWQHKQKWWCTKICWGLYSCFFFSFSFFFTRRRKSLTTVISLMLLNSFIKKNFIIRSLLGNKINIQK